ncbi:hypothetical protein FOG51_01083 [Hanseniaspora uvarum]|nr:hypothetical protein FOG48_00384 [Hanseniaspora uvarum]KAF0274126.1 hypothetical protein FOG51_01083 [Hanseniaspora uvarum]KAF0277227.1 hypothetical protein FOG50_01856 [Hanseniaspora uvarum]GMM40684.1 mitochondrial 54S ribosomal protein YmL6 [Hanseniaspora uvarum]
MLSRSLLGNTIAKSLIARRLNATIAESVVAAEQGPELTAEQVSAIEQESLLSSLVNPGTHTLITTRSFPSLEPNSMIPVPVRSLFLPLRKDTLFDAKYFEENSLKIGEIILGRSNWKFSRRKLAPQKHTGRARVGDGNSPIRLNGASAFGRDIPSNPNTEINISSYQMAFNTAMSYQYKMGKLFVIGENYGDVEAQYSKIPEHDSIDFNSIPESLKFKEISEEENYLMILKKFIKAHDVEILPKVLFVTREKGTLLERAIDEVAIKAKKTQARKLPIKKKFKDKSPIPERPTLSADNMFVVDAENLTVTDILEADRIYMDLPSFEFVVTTNVVNMSM